MGRVLELTRQVARARRLLVLIARTEAAFVRIAGATISDRTANGLVCGSIETSQQRGACRAAPIVRSRYFRCLLTSLVISNMFTAPLPPNTVLSGGSALIMRLFLASCRPFFLM